MKSLIFNLVLVALFLIPATINITAQSEDFPKNFMVVKLKPCPEPFKVELRLINLMNLQTDIQIVNNKEEVLSRQMIDDQPAWAIRYTFRGKHRGEYHFVVHQKNASHRRSIRVEKDGITILPQAHILADKGNDPYTGFEAGLKSLSVWMD